ncbi:hypothetical protein DVH24_011270 [Malus domestica]|uniref:Uncharacterized protein n=1 Tax=Malus domestica TaxID=3750 RepID=A0A498JUU4_MALDO|nr:hypothetical protein DVH24_011270 [Malus domestica]
MGAGAKSLGVDLLLAIIASQLTRELPSGHPSWDCFGTNSLNFGVLMELEANDIPRGLMLYVGGHVHIRHRGSTPLGDVGSNNVC